MFDITKLYLKIPKFLTDEECDYLISCHDNSDKVGSEISRESITGKIKQSSFKAVKLEPNTDGFLFARNKTNEVVKRYVEYIQSMGYFHSSIKDLLKYSHSYRVLKYDVGSSIHSHSDHNLGIYGSVSINLNENYQGGNFKLFNGSHDVKLKKGDAFMFPADYFWTHEVTEITEGVRYSLNSFITRFPNEILERINIESHIMEEDYLRAINNKYILGPYN